MTNHDLPRPPEPDPDNLGIPDIPFEMLPQGFWSHRGYAEDARIAEMLSMGHLLEAGKLIVGKEFFLEPAETVQLPHRSQQDEQDIESE
jgi:hypothetical protein